MAGKVSNKEATAAVAAATGIPVREVREISFLKVERLVEFDNFKKSSIFSEAERRFLPKSEAKKRDEQVIVVFEGRNIYQYGEEYPIVVYQPNSATDGVGKRNALNRFIKNVVVSTGISGKKYSLVANKMVEEITDFDTITYYEDVYGDCHKIISYDISKFLLRKPQLTVSPDGVLIFYTEDKMLVTVDCKDYSWVEPFADNCTAIENVEMVDDGCIVTLREGEDVRNGYLGCVSEKAPRHKFKMTFKLSFAFNSCLNPEFDPIDEECNK